MGGRNGKRDAHLMRVSSQGIYSYVYLIGKARHLKRICSGLTRMRASRRFSAVLALYPTHFRDDFYSGEHNSPESELRSRGVTLAFTRRPPPARPPARPSSSRLSAEKARDAIAKSANNNSRRSSILHVQ